MRQRQSGLSGVANAITCMELPATAPRGEASLAEERARHYRRRVCVPWRDPSWLDAGALWSRQGNVCHESCRTKYILYHIIERMFPDKTRVLLIVPQNVL